MDTRISEIIKDKGPWVLTIDKNASVFDAIKLMEERRVGSIMVMENDEVCGIFTERDYLRRITLKGRTSRETPIHEVMTTDVIFVNPTYTVGQCMSIMSEKKLRHLPVVDAGALVGLISIGDCVKRVSKDAQAQVHYLTEYVTGKYPG